MYSFESNNFDLTWYYIFCNKNRIYQYQPVKSCKAFETTIVTYNCNSNASSNVPICTVRVPSESIQCLHFRFLHDVGTKFKTTQAVNVSNKVCLKQSHFRPKSRGKRQKISFKHFNCCRGTNRSLQAQRLAWNLNSLKIAWKNSIGWRGIRMIYAFCSVTMRNGRLVRRMLAKLIASYLAVWIIKIPSGLTEITGD